LAHSRRFVATDGSSATGNGSESSKESSKNFWALRDVNLRAVRGEAVGIIGSNGAGKSTMLKVLSRVLRPDRGSITVNGRLSGLIEVGAGFHGDLSGRENIYINGAILGMTTAEIRRKFDSIVDFSEISEFLDMPVKRYSSGMYVRLGFAIAAHTDPDVLLVDEVLSVGDVAFKAKCMDAMRGFLRRGTCILFVSHNLSQIKRFCDRVVLLDHGKVLLEGPADAAIAEYSRLISDLEDVNPESVENKLLNKRKNSSSPARITAVRMLGPNGRPSRSFVSGEPLRIEVDYLLNPSTGPTIEPNFAISVHMFGSELSFHFESRRDGFRVAPYSVSNPMLHTALCGIPLCDAPSCDAPQNRQQPEVGTVAVNFPNLSLGEGVYQVSVALADKRGLPEHDWHDRAYRFNVVADGITNGPIYQPRQWEVVSQNVLDSETSDELSDQTSDHDIDATNCGTMVDQPDGCCQPGGCLLGVET
ncbi:MAG: ABC transporter ATP-binding protein, partial [Phycisphaerae bacterium]|nr:ABC transporter ATP-binding protein [Phycisphaerae bacterium]